jgi:two-component system CheB/CheR fusion protein
MFSAELERKVQERTQLLKETNVDLEHSNKNLEQFAFIASHDLQEPLRKIRTFSSILAEDFSDQLSAEGKKVVNRINTSSERLSILIQDVLNFSRIENSKNVYVTTDLKNILKNVIEDFHLLISEKNAVIQIENLPTIEIIPHQINQLFYNLISNSLKFSSTSVQPTINVSSRIISANEVTQFPSLNRMLTYCEIIIKDNGIGFEEKYAERIFGIFQRLHTIQEFSGTGIGLALCKKIIVNHHGEIFAKSKQNGEGAAFHVILPLKQVDVNKP